MDLRQLIISFALLSIAKNGSAQATTSVADSAAVARNAVQDASAALQRGDIRAARALVDRAANAWPTQPAYIWARASLAARDSDAAVLEQALLRYADLGLGRDLHTDSKFARLLAAKFNGIAARHDANRAAKANSAARQIIADSTFWPEGIDADPRNGLLYVASVRHRTVAEVTRRGSVRELLQRDRADLAPVLGVRVDTARNSVWITTSGLRNVPGFHPEDSTKASLLRVDIATGRIVQRFEIPYVVGGHVLGDLTISPDGSVYVTDSTQPVIYHLRSGATALDEIRSPLFNSLQGIVPTPDGKTIYIADYALGILRMNVATGAIVPLANSSRGTALGCDGITWHNDAIICVQNGVSPARIVRLVPDVKSNRILSIDVLDQNFAIADEPTIGTMLGDEFVYVANSQWEKFDDAGVRNAAHALTAPVVLRLKLAR